MIPPGHLNALREISTRFSGSDFEWALTGSTSFSLQGIPVMVNDIDIQTDVYGAYKIGDLLSSYVARTIQFSIGERIRSHYGQFIVQGIPVDVMGDVQKREIDGDWEEVVDIRPYTRKVKVKELNIPVLDLEYEVLAYKKMGREVRAAMLREWLDQKQT
jgi:hypothetical protein